MRPIVSCSGSPGEKLAWLVAQILKPLLKHVPPHLRNTHDHNVSLSSLPPDELKSLQIYSADISALYTNINVNLCIDNVMDMAAEYWEELHTVGLTLDDIRNILHLGLSNSYFTFNNRLYKQLDGLFMGYPPSPVCAVIRGYHFEKNSIYTDIHHITRFVQIYYGRYMDDVGSVCDSRESA